MSVKGYPLVPAASLEAVVRRAANTERVRAGVLLLIVGAAVWGWLALYADHFLGTSVGLFLFTLWLYWPEGEAWESHHLDDVDAELLGRFSRSQLRDAIDEVRRSYGEKEHPNIFVVKTTMPIAMTRNADIINWVRSWNAVWISSHLLTVLTEDELKSIFAHEMCHYSKHTTFWGRYFYVHALCCAVLVTVAYIAALDWFFPSGGAVGAVIMTMVILSALGLFPLVMLLANLVVIGASSLTERGDSQAIESLCDFEGAKRYGPIAMTNALLKVSTRSEIFQRVVEAFTVADEGAEPRVDDGSDGEELQAAAAQEAIVYLEQRLPMAFLSVDEAQETVDAAINHAVNAVEGARVKKRRAGKFLRWLKFDNRVRNQRLDLGEYEDFIDAVTKAPESPLFGIPEECDPELEAAAEHPSIRNRVLFLAHNLRPKALVE